MLPHRLPRKEHTSSAMFDFTQPPYLEAYRNSEKATKPSLTTSSQAVYFTLGILLPSVVMGKLYGRCQI